MENEYAYVKNNMHENSMGTHIINQIYGEICVTLDENSLDQAEKVRCPGWEKLSRTKPTCNRLGQL